MPAMEKKII